MMTALLLIKQSHIRSHDVASRDLVNFECFVIRVGVRLGLEMTWQKFCTLINKNQSYSSYQRWLSIVSCQFLVKILINYK